MVLFLSRYRDALAYLFARATGATKLGLDRTLALLESLGNPHERLRAFHVAGTNGKGSVAAMIEAVLRRHGLRVGKYTSPHLIDFRERIILDGRPIEEEDVVRFVEKWMPRVEAVGATFFEATTALALDVFDSHGVDVAVVETGMGGRLDATNVLTPVVATVTNVALEHTEYLGSTLEAIAAEKAGIFKSRVPAVIGEPPGPIQSLLERFAVARGASDVVLASQACDLMAVRLDATGTTFNCGPNRSGLELRLGTVGRHQATNAATALATLDAAGPSYRVKDEEIREALRTLIVPGRFQLVGHHVFDVAHNPDGARVLAETLREVFPDGEIVAVVCVLGDKDWRRMLAEFSTAVSRFIFTDAPTVPASRKWDLHAVTDHALAHGLKCEAVPDFDSALESAALSGQLVLVTGSFHTVGDAMARLQPSERPA